MQVWKIQVRKNQGVTTYLSRYCPNFSNVTAPIRELLHRKNEFHMLAYYDPRKPTVLQADCSETACASVLMQYGRPIEFASRLTSNDEGGAIMGTAGGKGTASLTFWT